MIQVYMLFGASFVFFSWGVAFVIRGRNLPSVEDVAAVPIQSFDEIKSLRVQTENNLQQAVEDLKKMRVVSEGPVKSQKIEQIEEIEESPEEILKPLADIAQEVCDAVSTGLDSEEIVESPQKAADEDFFLNLDRINEEKALRKKMNEEALKMQKKLEMQNTPYSDDEVNMLKSENQELRDALKKELVSKDSSLLTEGQKEDYQEKVRQCQLAQNQVEGLTEENYRLKNMLSEFEDYKADLEKKLVVAKQALEKTPKKEKGKFQNSKEMMTLLRNTKSIVARAAHENNMLKAMVEDLKLNFRKIKELNVHLIEKDKLLQYELTKSRAELAQVRGAVVPAVNEGFRSRISNEEHICE